jgi:hypothetical protein
MKLDKFNIKITRRTLLLLSEPFLEMHACSDAIRLFDLIPFETALEKLTPALISAARKKSIKAISGVALLSNPTLNRWPAAVCVFAHQRKNKERHSPLWMEKKLSAFPAVILKESGLGWRSRSAASSRTTSTPAGEFSATLA